MTLLIKKVSAALVASREDAALVLSEDPGLLQLSGRMSRETLEAWQLVIDESCSFLNLDLKDESDDSILPKNGISGERHRLTISFISLPITPRFFTLEGWRSFLYSDLAIQSAKIVQLAFINDSFETCAFRVEPWVDLSVQEILAAQILNADISPRRQVRSQSVNFMAPAYIEPWILKKSIGLKNEATEIWCEIATKRIAAALSNELYIDGDVETVTLFGQPPRKIIFGEFNKLTDSMASLQDAAKWVYLDGKDIEIRHTFLSGELARAWETRGSFCEELELRLPGALESAHLIYKAHLRSGSKETLKALADLRKALTDEVQKFLQQTRDLSSTVWRDVAIALGVLAVRITMGNTKSDIVPHGNFAAIYFAVALYIGISYSITVATNTKFINIMNASREHWRKKLYAFLDDDDYRELADAPLKNASDAYAKAQNRTTWVVGVVIVALLIGIAIEMQWIDIAKSQQTISVKDIVLYNRINIILGGSNKD